MDSPYANEYLANLVNSMCCLDPAQRPSVSTFLQWLKMNSYTVFHPTNAEKDIFSEDLVINEEEDCFADHLHLSFQDLSSSSFKDYHPSHLSFSRASSESKFSSLSSPVNPSASSQNGLISALPMSIDVESITFPSSRKKKSLSHETSTLQPILRYGEEDLVQRHSSTPNNHSCTPLSLS